MGYNRYYEGQMNPLNDVFAQRAWYAAYFLKGLGGLVGFFFFVLCFFTFFKSLSGLKDTQLKFISTGFIIILLINFIFESVFERYSGISFFCFFFCGILSFYRKTYFKIPLNFFR